MSVINPKDGETDDPVLPPRNFNPRLYLALRRAGFAWRDCLSILWHGGTVQIEEVPDARAN